MQLATVILLTVFYLYGLVLTGQVLAQFKDQQVLKVFKVSKVSLVLKETRVHKDLKVFKEFKDQLVQQV